MVAEEEGGCSPLETERELCVYRQPELEPWRAEDWVEDGLAQVS